jgi:hypothetical protein
MKHLHTEFLTNHLICIHGLSAMKARFMLVVTAGSGAAEIHMSSWNMFVTAQRSMCLRPQQRVYGPLFFMETTITGIVYLDMLQQFLLPSTDENDEEGRIHFQQNGTPPHYLGEVLEEPQHPFPRLVDW